jgi:hypothetical protein
LAGAVNSRQEARHERLRSDHRGVAFPLIGYGNRGPCEPGRGRWVGQFGCRLLIVASLAGWHDHPEDDAIGTC